MKTVKQLAIAMCAMAMAACAEEGNPVKDVTTTGEPCEVYLTIATDSHTRGITDNFVNGTDLENVVNVLEFYVFDKATGAPDTETNSTSGQEGYVKITTTTNAKTHKIKLTGGDKRIVSVINMNLGVPATNTYAGLKAKMATWEYTHAASSHNARVENRTNGFEMTGEKEVTIVAGSVNNSININVARTSSRINAPTFSTSESGFINLNSSHLAEIWGADVDELDGKDMKFVNHGYVVINGRSHSDAFFIGNANGDDREHTVVAVGSGTVKQPKWDLWSPTGKTVLRSTFDASGFYTNTYSGPAAAADYFLVSTVTGENRVYVFENKPATKTIVSGGSTITGYDPASTYAVIIKGTFVIDNDDTNANGLNKTRYWRVDLTRDDDYHVFRNSSYSININRISTPGYGTPKEAEEDNPIIPANDQTTADVTIIVSQWRLNDYETDM